MNPSQIARTLPFLRKDKKESVEVSHLMNKSFAPDVGAPAVIVLGILLLFCLFWVGSWAYWSRKRKGFFRVTDKRADLESHSTGSWAGDRRSNQPDYPGRSI